MPVSARSPAASPRPRPAFLLSPPLRPLLLQNECSDARDHCANERTFLSYFRLVAYLTLVSVAISLSFHLNYQPSDLERRMAMPLGIVFWLLTLLILLLGLANYFDTLNKYRRKTAIVQTGWRTQLLLAALAFCITGTCVVLFLTRRRMSRALDAV